MEDQLALMLTCLKLLLSFPSFGSTGASIERTISKSLTMVIIFFP